MNITQQGPYNSGGEAFSRVLRGEGKVTALPFAGRIPVLLLSLFLRYIRCNTWDYGYWYFLSFGHQYILETFHKNVYILPTAGGKRDEERVSVLSTVVWQRRNGEVASWSAPLWFYLVRCVWCVGDLYGCMERGRLLLRHKLDTVITPITPFIWSRRQVCYLSSSMVFWCLYVSVCK